LLLNNNQCIFVGDSKAKTWSLKTMNNTFLLKASVIAVAAVFSQGIFAKPAGNITFKSGDVSITRADKTVIKAEKNVVLNEGDTIETKNGRIQLAFIDGGKVSLQPNTIYKINKFEFSGKEDGTEYNFTELVKGGLRTISGLIGHKNRDHYQVKTVVATIGIRGTEYTAYFDSALTMTTNHGSVDVCALTGGCLNALTGQTIVVTPGSAPAYTDKQINISAAKPVSDKAELGSSKAVFSAGEQADVPELVAATQASQPFALIGAPTLTVIAQAQAATPAPAVTPTPSPPVTPTPVAAGNATIVSLATMKSGPVDHNGVYVGTTSFTGDNLIQYVDNSNTPIILSGTVLEANSDSFVKWGRASDGTYNAQNMAMTNWITGTATPALALANLTATYKVTSSTAPYVVSNNTIKAVGAANSVTGGMFVNFNYYVFGYSLTVPLPGQAINVNVVGGGGLTAGSASFKDSIGIVTSSACNGGCAGLLAGGSVVQGSLFGPNAERAGLQYGVQYSGSGLSGGGGNLYGGVVLTKQ
jgi:FecR protein